MTTGPSGTTPTGDAAQTQYCTRAESITMSQPNRFMWHFNQNRPMGLVEIVVTGRSRMLEASYPCVVVWALWPLTVAFEYALFNSALDDCM